ncbi:chymotrypsinogen B-like [Haliotis rubra]|uniref:chymotrypsinogen B-like n=1 Tax=Haliotis rubra TaxID=36100 RepID=UPI001EE59A80|nr:chymotrypsinogen B-like [Haliotis rubra]
MATRLQTLVLLVGFLGNSALAQLPWAFQRNSLCTRGAKGSSVRSCHPGRYASDCPAGWKAVNPQNYLLCWATANICCEQDAEDPTSGVNHPQCGLIGVQARFTQSEDEEPCQSPWQASLRRVTDVNRPQSISNSVHVAGGVLVQSKWVLTTPLSVLFAGRNLPTETFQNQMFVVLGDYDHQTLSGGEQLRRVRQVYFHPEFNFDVSTNFLNVLNISLANTERVWQENAFALIELENDVDINDCVRPACLPSTSTQRCTSSQCKATGWGANENEELRDRLQKVDMTLFGKDACEIFEYYKNGVETSYTAKTGCAVNDRGSFACVGDFGGPVVCQGDNVNSPRTVEGLGVTQLRCDDTSNPMRVALVRDAMNWIEQIIRTN